MAAARARSRRYDAVAFDLLTGLLNSWALWNTIAGSDDDGFRWRRRYLDLTYSAGAYRPYLEIVREAAVHSGLPERSASELARRWATLQPWPDAEAVLRQLFDRVPLAIVTNCSNELARIAVACTRQEFAAVVTAESVGYYKPHPEPYRAVIAKLGIAPERTLFVAGSAADVPGAKAVGMHVFWHNRIGLQAVASAEPEFTADSLEPLLRIV
jgi:2-haloacid dehalogenase